MEIALRGRIDSSNVKAVEEKVASAVSGSSYESLTFDATDLVYISSAGLRVLLKAAKDESAAGRPKPKVVGVSRDVYDIFETTGFVSLLDVEKAYRVMSVEGCECIGKGFFGDVYRIDDDTIVKVYHTPDSISMIKSEQKKAKLAFLKGLPTAISYDIVKVGDNYGSVFELLKAKTFNDLIIEDPEHADETIVRYADLIKSVHEAEASPEELPLAADIFKGYLDVIAEYVEAEDIERLRGLLDDMKEDRHIIHGDLQMKNVMLVDGEPMLIDMDTLCLGDPVFDIQGLYLTYMAFGEDEPDNSMKFLGISREMSERIWHGVLARYFEGRDEAFIKEASDKARLLCMIRFMYLLATTDLKEGELGSLRIRHTKETIAKLLDTVKNFGIR